MTILFPAKLRAGLYILTALGTPVFGYLLSKGFIGTLEMTLWTAEVAVVASLAAFNTSPTQAEETAEKKALQEK